MIYVLRQNGHIISFGSSPFGLGENQTQDELDTTMSEYANRFKLSANKTVIQADGEDAVTVLVQTSLAVPNMDVLVNGVTVTVPIVGGQGNLPDISADVEGVIYIEPADKTLFCTAGNGSLTIQAVEA